MILETIVVLNLLVVVLSNYLVDQKIFAWLHDPVEESFYKSSAKGSVPAGWLHSLWVCKICMGQWIAFGLTGGFFYLDGVQFDLADFLIQSVAANALNLGFVTLISTLNEVTEVTELSVDEEFEDLLRNEN